MFSEMCFDLKENLFFLVPIWLFLKRNFATNVSFLKSSYTQVAVLSKKMNLDKDIMYLQNKTVTY